MACFLNLQAFHKYVRNPYDVALRGRMHVTYWSDARQHACGRKARRHTIGLHVTQGASSHNSIQVFHTHALQQHFRCRQSEQARCWLLRLMYRPVWCKHLECIYNMLHKQLNPMGRLGCTLLSLILNKPMTPFRTVFFRLAGTDIRKKTHGKKFCTQKFGRAEPFYANMEKYRLHPAIFALEILLCHFPTDFHYICIALKLQQTSHSQLPAVAALCHVHMLCLHEDKTERERKQRQGWQAA